MKDRMIGVDLAKRVFQDYANGARFFPSRSLA